MNECNVKESVNMFTDRYGLIIININIRNLSCNSESKTQYILDLDKSFDIFTVSETWLIEESNLNDFVLNNYTTYYTNCPVKRGMTYYYTC